MKKSLPCEIGAVCFGLLGAVVLVGVNLPYLNPAYFQSKFGEERLPRPLYVGGTAVAVVLLAVAWLLTRTAQRLKKG
jgi:hypothetical protein